MSTFSGTRPLTPQVWQRLYQKFVQRIERSGLRNLARRISACASRMFLRKDAKIPNDRNDEYDIILRVTRCNRRKEYVRALQSITYSGLAGSPLNPRTVESFLDRPRSDARPDFSSWEAIAGGGSQEGGRATNQE
eukprot:1183719-Prorocentrum_minimum.AAC.4